jgi:hypothetical protein
MSETLTSNFLYSADYKTQCVSLNAQDAKVPRGTIICVNGSLPVSASFTGTAATISPTAAFTGTEASLSGEAETYTPAGTVAVTGASYTPAGTVSLGDAVAADGTFDIIGADSGAYAQPYGVLLNDVPASGSAQPADVVVFGELFKDYINGVYKAANSNNNLPASVAIALRNIGIYLK